MRKYKKGIIYYLVLSVLLIVVLGVASDTYNINAKKIDNYSNNSNAPIAFGKAREPALLPGMKAIYWENGEEKELKGPFLEKEKWYDYNDKRWANAKTKDGSYWVWIPTFAYRIAYYKDANKTDLKGYRIQNDYVDKNYKHVKFPEDVITKNIKVEIKYILEDGTDIPEGYTIHPAFFKDKVMGNGFWIAKYKAVGNMKSPEFKKSKTKLTNVSVGEAFSKLDNSSLEGNSYGFTDDFVKVGLPRNTELGAIYYLTQSIAGTNKDTVSYIDDKEESSTGNITGVYDLNDGTREWTSAYISNSSKSIEENGKSLKTSNTQKVGSKDIDIKSKIELYPFKIDAKEYADNIKEVERNRYINYGDGIYETTVPMSDKNSALGSGISDYPYGDNVFITRGSDKPDKNKSMFSFRGDTGKANKNIGFRASAYIFPKVKDNHVRITLKTSDGIIYDTETNQEMGKEVYITITKGAIPKDRYIVKNSDAKFEGWSIPLGGVPIYENVILTATFNKSGEPPHVETAKIVFKDGLTSEVYYENNVSIGTNVKEIADKINPKKEGYIFTGWDNDVNIKADKDMTFTALWKKDKAKRYKAMFLKDESGEIFFQEEVAENSIANGPKEVPEKEGYVFIKWSPDISKTIIRKDTVFTPIFEKREEPNPNPDPGDTEEKKDITIIFIAVPGHFQSGTGSRAFRIKEGTTLNENPTVLKALENSPPTNIDYTFNRWSIDYNTPINSNMQIKSEWTIKKYKYSFFEMSQIGKVEKVYKEGEFNSGEKLNKYAPPNPKKSGYIFQGWRPNVSREQRQDIAFYATWVKDISGGNVKPNRQEVKIVFDPNGGKINGKTTFIIQKGFSLPFVPTPEKPGFVFAGWKGSTQQRVDAPQNVDQVYVASWKLPRDYTLPNQQQGGFITTGSQNNRNTINSGNNGASIFTTRNGELIPINPDGTYQNNGNNTELQNLNNQNNGGIVNKKQEEDYPRSGIKENVVLIILSIIVPIIGIYMVVNWMRLKKIDKEGNIK